MQGLKAGIITMDFFPPAADTAISSPQEASFKGASPQFSRRMISLYSTTKACSEDSN